MSALLLLQQDFDIATKAAEYINDNVKTAEEALQGARDIIAETVNEDANIRAAVRRLFEQEATLQSKVLADKETAGIKYKDYFDFTEPIHKMPSHRILAILRGFLEGYLRMGISPEEENAIELIESRYIKGFSNCAEHIKKAIKDSYRRLLQPAAKAQRRKGFKTLF